MPEHRYSLEVARQVAQGAARLSYDATLGLLQSMTGARVPKRQAEELVRRAAEDFDDFYATTTLDPQAPTGPLLLLSLDQKGVVLLPEDLHPRTQKAAAEAPRKLETRWCKGEAARGRKRMAMVAAVYTVAPHVRSPTEVIAGLRHVRPADPSPRPRPEYKRVWASLSRSPQDVIHDAFTEAETRDPHHQKQWIVLVDGDNKLTRWVQAEAQRRGISVTLVLDFIHALEYLWRAAHVFHDEGTKEGEAFVLERLERMLEGKTSHVVAGLRRMATQRGLSPAARAPVDKAAQYLLKRTAMMRYDTLLATGAPIATGVIEGACRHLINDRLDVTGARWRIRGAEAVLRLRSLLASGDFDDYWRFHEGAEAFRNHESRYADCTVPQLTSTRPGRHLRLVTPVD